MSSRISAILGPTNTGKTIQLSKALNHKNGVMAPLGPWQKILNMQKAN